MDVMWPLLPSPSTENSKIDLEMQENVAYNAHTIPIAQNPAYTAVQSSEGIDVVYDEPHTYEEPSDWWRLSGLTYNFLHNLEALLFYCITTHIIHYTLL